MDEHDDWLAQRFEEHRSQLSAVAYRMLGSISEADDALQVSWLRLSRSGTSGIENLGGWMTTIVARVCLNMLRSRSSRREQLLGVHVPDPIVSRADGIDPEHEALLADSVGLALLVVLETLTPAERLAFVLHDMFSVPFEEIAPIVGRSEVAARRLRGATRGARPGRRAPSRCWCRACGLIEGGARCGSRGRAGALLLAGCSLRTTGARQRSRGSRGFRGTADCGNGLHGQAREDRRNRHTR